MTDRQSPFPPLAEQPDNIFATPVAGIVRDEALEAPGDWKLLRRLQLPERLARPTGAPRALGLVVDTETTGNDITRDETVQLALLPFVYEPDTGHILRVGHDLAYSGLRESGVPVSAEALSVHGLGPEVLAGQDIDGDRVEKMVDRAAIVVAHHAGFDRPMVEKHWPAFREADWACSMTCVDWRGHGFGSAGLANLAADFGFFHKQHDALADCHAVLGLLSRTGPGGSPVLAHALEAAATPNWVIVADGSPFEFKDHLKERGYSWRPDHLPGGKVWWIETSYPAAEMAWLDQAVYSPAEERRRNNHPAPQPFAVEVTARTRFSERLWIADKRPDVEDKVDMPAPGLG